MVLVVGSFLDGFLWIVPWIYYFDVIILQNWSSMVRVAVVVFPYPEKKAFIDRVWRKVW